MDAGNPFRTSCNRLPVNTVFHPFRCPFWKRISNDDFLKVAYIPLAPTIIDLLFILLLWRQRILAFFLCPLWPLRIVLLPFSVPICKPQGNTLSPFISLLIIIAVPFSASHLPIANPSPVPFVSIRCTTFCLSANFWFFPPPPPPSRSVVMCLTNVQMVFFLFQLKFFYAFFIYSWLLRASPASHLVGHPNNVWLSPQVM